MPFLPPNQQRQSTEGTPFLCDLNVISVIYFLLYVTLHYWLDDRNPACLLKHVATACVLTAGAMLGVHGDITRAPAAGFLPASKGL